MMIYLAPGYEFISNAGPALHVSTIRRFTSDFERFIKWLPVSRQLDGLDASSSEAEDIIDRACQSADDLDALADTLDEVGEIQRYAAGHIRATSASR